MAAHPKYRLRRNKEAVGLERRDRIMEMYLRGENQASIARIEGITQGAVSQHLKAVREEWQERISASTNEAKAEQIARLNYLRSLALEGYEKSLENAEVDVKKIEKALRKARPDMIAAAGGNHVKKVKIGKETREIPANSGQSSGAVDSGEDGRMELIPVKEESSKTIRGQAGNPAYLQIVLQCDEAIAKILGLYIDPGVTNNTLNIWQTVIGAVGQAKALPKPLDPIEVKIAEAETVDAVPTPTPKEEAKDGDSKEA